MVTGYACPRLVPVTDLLVVPADHLNSTGKLG